MRKISTIVGMVLMVGILFVSLALAQAPAISPTPKKATPDFQILTGTLPITLNGDTLYRIKGGSFDGGLGIDLGSYKSLVILRAETSQSTAGSPFVGIGLMFNIPSLMNAIGANWQAGAINPSIGIIPGYDFGQKRFDAGIVLSIISINF
jgi:hypothetical protein